MKINKYKKGFTLLEILLVIAAIGILAAIVLIAINPNKQIAQARDTVRQSDINTLQKSLDQYLIDNKAYPSSISTTPGYICNTEKETSPGSIVCGSNIDLRVLVPTYLASIPKDPQATGDNAGYIVAIAPNNKISITASLAERKAIVNNTFTVPSGLVLNLDAGNTASYPGSGTTWTDLSGNGNNGTLVNGPTYSSANGGSIVFDGVDDFINISSTSAFNWGLGDWSNDVWFFLPSIYASNNSYTTIFQTNQFFVGTLRSGLTGIPGFFTVGTNNMFTSSSYGSYTYGGFTYNPAGKWTNLSIVKNGATTYCYLNGSLYASKSSDTYTNQSNPGRIGIGLSGAEPLNGNLSNFKAYNRALTSTEIQQNFNAMRGRYGL
jgi:prepilin-type N-terminal cleavage/methylation domain-containing protein